MNRYKAIIEKTFRDINSLENEGNVANYIPELSKVGSNSFGVAFLSRDSEEIGVGDCLTRFSIQSISKVLSLCLAYKLLGEQIWERVGVEPSGNAFNSLVQLETDNGIPRNPFINGGALVICDILISNLEDPKSDFLQFVREISSNDDIDFDETVAKSEELCGYRNKAVCNFIKSFENLDNEPDVVLDFYFHMCSIEMNCKELVKTFRFLAFSNCEFTYEKYLLNSSQRKRINALMQTCGFYDESGEFAFKVGLPGKSGVGGGIVALHPDKYCLAVWSPRLNKKGNSYKGMKFLELFTSNTEESIF